jgi:hypothetical protein
MTPPEHFFAVLGIVLFGFLGAMFQMLLAGSEVHALGRASVPREGWRP